MLEEKILKIEKKEDRIEKIVQLTSMKYQSQKDTIKEVK